MNTKNEVQTIAKIAKNAWMETTQEKRDEIRADFSYQHLNGLENGRNVGISNVIELLGKLGYRLEVVQIHNENGE